MTLKGSTLGLTDKNIRLVRNIDPAYNEWRTDAGLNLAIRCRLGPVEPVPGKRGPSD